MCSQELSVVCHDLLAGQLVSELVAWTGKNANKTKVNTTKLPYYTGRVKCPHNRGNWVIEALIVSLVSLGKGEGSVLDSCP